MNPYLYAVAILSSLNAVGCATVSMTSATAPQAFEAPGDLPDAARLDVAVIEFDPGLPADGTPIPEDLYPEIREAESKLLPIHLEKTLAETGHWGADSLCDVQLESFRLRLHERAALISFWRSSAQSIVTKQTGAYARFAADCSIRCNQSHSG